MGRYLKGAWYILLSFVSISVGISLEEAEEKALRNFFPLQSERLEVRKAHLSKSRTMGNFFPTLNLEASFNLSRKQSFTLSLPFAPPREFIFQKESYPRLTLYVLQTLFDPTLMKEYELHGLLLNSQRYALAQVEEDVIYRVREAYVNALKAKASVSIYRKHLERVQAHLGNAEKLYRQGVVAYKDVLETKVKVFETKEKLASAEAGYRKALNYLSYLVGEEVRDVEALNIAKEELSEDHGRLLQGIEKSPLLRRAEEMVRIAAEKVELATSYFYPKVSLEAFYQRTEESDLFPKDRYGLSLVMKWNLFSGMKRFRSLEMAKLEYRQALNFWRDVRERLRTELKSLLEEVKAVRVRIEYARKQLEDAQEHLRIAEEKYKAGLGTSTEVLDAQSYLLTSEETLRMNEYDLMLTLFKLKKVIGHGKE